MTRGGRREGAGRPYGTNKEKTVIYYRRVKPEWVEVLDKKLQELKGGNMTKFEKIKTYDVETFAKWLKQFSSFEGDWQTLRLWLESDGNEGLLEE